MNETRIARLFGQIEQKYIEEADPTETSAKKRVRSIRIIPLAACLALAVMAFPVYKMLNHTVPAAHSYVTTDSGGGGVTQDSFEYTATGGSEGSDGGDRDVGMSPDELAQAMLDVGYTQAEIDEYQSIGYQMTWAKWWKFVGEQQNSEEDATFDLDSLKEFSRQELYVSTGALPGGAYIGDVFSMGQAVSAYQNLMNHFGGNYPDWYGGAYLDESYTLIVCLVESEDPGDKSLELQVLDWAGGRTSRVAFTDVKYSLAFLRNLQKRVESLPELKPISSWGCGVNEESGQVELTIPQADEALLIALAKLDPEDDAILVQVSEGYGFATDVADGEPFSDLDGNPAGYGIS